MDASRCECCQPCWHYSIDLCCDVWPSRHNQVSCCRAWGRSISGAIKAMFAQVDDGWHGPAMFISAGAVMQSSSGSQTQASSDSVVFISASVAPHEVPADLNVLGWKQTNKQACTPSTWNERQKSVAVHSVSMRHGPSKATTHR